MIMNRFGQLARMVGFGLLILVLGGCFGRKISDSELHAVFKPFFEASGERAKGQALEAVEKVALDVGKGSLRETRTDSTGERNRKMLHLLRATRYEIRWGLTEAALRRLTKNGLSGRKSKVEKQIDKMFNSDLVRGDLKVLGELSPDDALAFVTFMCRACVVERGRLPQGAHRTTWAALDLVPVVRKLKLSRLAGRSAIVKLFIEGGALTLPKETRVRFRWSDAESIVIELTPVVWSKTDIVEIESSASKETVTRFADALERAREKTR